MCLVAAERGEYLSSHVDRSSNLDPHFSKTTTMLFKMLGIERTWDTLQDTLQDTLPRPRQLFVTQSRVLAEKVEEYYRKLSQSHAAAQRTAEESDQLAAAKQANQDQGLVDRDEEEFWRGDLPKSYIAQALVCTVEFIMKKGLYRKPCFTGICSKSTSCSSGNFR